MKLKLRQRAVALLAVVCLLVSMVPMTGRAAGEMKSATLWVRCNQIPLDGSTITATLKGNGEDVLLGTSTNGELLISADSTEMEGKRIEVSILLPEGYGFPFDTYPRELTNTFEPEELFEGGMQIWDAVRVGGEESLFLTQDYLELSVGDTLDISSAIDQNAASGIADLYFHSKDGEQTRVGADWWSISNGSCCAVDNSKPNLIQMVKAGIIEIHFYYEEYMASLKVNIKGDDPTDNNESSNDIFRYSILYNGQVLDGAEITIQLSKDQWNNGTTIATSNTGVIEVSRSSEEIKNYKYFIVKMKLPEGYQFLNGEYMENESTIAFDTRAILNPDITFNVVSEVTKPAVDGSLEISKGSIRAKVGDVVDLSRAVDLDAEDIQLFYTAPNGTRTRVVCDDYYISPMGLVEEKDGNKLKLVEEGLTKVIFYYKNTAAKLEIDVTNSDTSYDKIQISDNEYIYIYPDGTEHRVIIAEDGTFLEGNKDHIPTGGRFESKPVTAGDIFNKAKAEIKKRFDSENLRVFEMNLWDALGNAVHRLPGMVKVDMELPGDFKIADGKTLLVYRMEDNGKLTRCKTTFENGRVSFLTNHFSTYILAEVDKQMAGPSEPLASGGTTNGTGDTTATGAAVTAPKTGERASMAYIGVILAAAALAAVNWKKGRRNWYREPETGVGI